MPKSPDQISPNIPFLAGQISGLVMACAIFARLHPSQDQLRQMLAEARTHGIPSTEQVPIAEATVEGFQQVMKVLQKAMEAAPPQFQ